VVNANWFPVSAEAPPVFDRSHRSVFPFNPVHHGQRDVRFVIQVSRHPGDGRAGNDFLDENHAAPPAIRRFVPDVKAQVHLLEIPVKRNRHAPHAGVQKEKTDDRDQAAALPQIQFGSRRNVRREQGWLDRVVQHRQMPPLGGEKNRWLGRGGVGGWRRVPLHFERGATARFAATI
jgi:hypothetical protein